jgi:hypothetical protein
VCRRRGFCQNVADISTRDVVDIKKAGGEGCMKSPRSFGGKE